jgi:spore coat protein SA
VKICHVAPELLPVPPTKGGAIERWIRDAARLLAARGHDVHVVSRDHGDGRLEDRIDGVQYHFVRVRRPPDQGGIAMLTRGVAYFAGVGRLLARIEPDVVHHHSRPGAMYVTRARARGARHVISLHSLNYGWSFGYGYWDRLLFRRAFRTCDRILCVSDFIRRHVVALYPDIAAKTMILYNGVDGRTFHPEPRDEGDCADPVVLFVGRVEERKGVHLLVDAFERTIRKRPGGARLAIVGPHSYWAAEASPFYSALIERCRTIPQIDLRRPTYCDAELAAVYRGAAVGVVPSVFPEALGLTSLEAQASGIPVVVSNAGGLPETVLAGESGVTFESGDVEGLAASVLDLLSDPHRRHSMGARARTWAMERFSWERIATQLEEIYSDVLAARAPA